MWVGWSAAWAGELTAGMLRTADRLELEVDHLEVSPDGERVLLFGAERAMALGPQGDPVATVEVSDVALGDISKSGKFALVHAGGVTVHSEAGREIGRLAAFGRVNDVALSPDGRFLGLATTLSSSVYDAVDGRTLWSNDGEATRIAYDGEGKLFVERGGAVVQVDAMSGAKRGGGTFPEPPGLLADGCVQLPDGPFCPSGAGAIGVQRSTGALWLLRDGAFDRWTALDELGVRAVGPEGGSAIAALAWIGTTDFLVARVDGQLERRGPGGGVVSQVTIPDCAPCAPVAIGGSADGLWAMAGDGTFMAWDLEGAPLLKIPKDVEALGLARTGDGRWVTLDLDGRIRIGGSPGKGGAIKALPGTIGVAAAGDTVVAWTDATLRVYGSDRGERPTPDLGAGRKPVAVALSPDGGAVAVLDAGGALHAYRTTDGRAMFRANAGITGTELGWAPGGGLVLVGGGAGGAPLRMFGGDGKELGELRIAPDGATEHQAIGPDGTLVLVHTDPVRQELKLVPWATLNP
ncbi:MAG: hypothetical protein ABMA64_28070 [Myxococcota bacterium]